MAVKNTYTPEVGDMVRDGTKKQGAVGTVLRIDKGQVIISIRHRYGPDTEGTLPLANVIHVCKETTWSGWESKICGRPVKENGMCGIHAGADKRVKANQEKRNREWEETRARNAARRTAQEQAEKVYKDSGIPIPLWQPIQVASDDNRTALATVRVDDLVHLYQDLEAANDEIRYLSELES